MQIRPTDFFLEASSPGLDEDDIKAQVSKKNLKEAYAYAREACGDRLRGFMEKDNI